MIQPETLPEHQTISLWLQMLEANQTLSGIVSHVLILRNETMLTKLPLIRQIWGNLCNLLVCTLATSCSNSSESAYCTFCFNKYALRIISNWHYKEKEKKSIVVCDGVDWLAAGVEGIKESCWDGMAPPRCACSQNQASRSNIEAGSQAQKGVESPSGLSCTKVRCPPRNKQCGFPGQCRYLGRL